MILNIKGWNEQVLCPNHNIWKAIDSEMTCCEMVKEEQLHIEEAQRDLGYLPAMIFTWNEPTIMAVTFTGLGLVGLIAKALLEDTKFGPKIDSFLEMYVKYVYPSCIVGIGVWAFVECVKIML